MSPGPSEEIGPVQHFCSLVFWTWDFAYKNPWQKRGITKIHPNESGFTSENSLFNLKYVDFMRPHPIQCAQARTNITLRAESRRYETRLIRLRERIASTKRFWIFKHHLGTRDVNFQQNFMIFKFAGSKSRKSSSFKMFARSVSGPETLHTRILDINPELQKYTQPKRIGLCIRKFNFSLGNT